MNALTKYIFLGLGILLLGYILWYFQSIVAYIIIAAILSLIGNPLVDFLSKFKLWKFKIRRWLGAMVTLILLWTVFIMFFRIFIPLIANEANQIASIDVKQVTQNLQEPLKNAEEIIKNYKITPESDQSIQESIAQKIVSILSISNISHFFGFIAGMLGDIFIAFFSISFVAFFFLKEDHLFSNSILSAVPEKYVDRASLVMRSIKNLLTRYFIGICVQVSLIILLVTIGLLFIAGFSLGKALVIGLIVGLMNVIPYIGPIMGAVFGVVIGIATNLHLDFYSEIVPMVGLMAIVFLTVQIIDNILFQPLIYSTSVKAHPLEIFLVIMMAGSLAGIVGMVLAIPTYTIFRVIAKEFFNNFKIVKNLTKNI